VGISLRILWDLQDKWHLAVPEVAQSRVCPRTIAEHEPDWSHASQGGQA